MKKSLLLLTALLCLAVGDVWASIDWVGEIATTNAGGFYLYNVGKSKFLNPFKPYGVDTAAAKYKWIFGNATIDASGTITTSYNNKTWYINIFKGTTDDGSIVAEGKDRTDPTLVFSTTTSGAYRFKNEKTDGLWGIGNGTAYFHLRDDNTVRAETSSDNTSTDWFLIGSNQFNNHVSLDAYATANSSIISYRSSVTSTNFPSPFWNRPTTAINNFTDYATWLLTNDKHEQIDDTTKVLSNWLRDADVVSAAYLYTKDVIENSSRITDDDFKSAKLTALDAATSEEDVWAVLREFRAAEVSVEIAKTTEGSTADISFCITNSNFQHSTWYLGWNGTIESTDESDDTKKNIFVRHDGDTKDNNYGEGNTFAEMWVAKGSKAFGKGDINQTITLPAGLYTLSADVASRNITSQLYIKFDGTEVTLDCSNASHAVVSQNFSLSATKTVTIGYKHASATSGGSTDIWTAVDAFTLTYLSPSSYSPTPGSADDPSAWGWCAGTTVNNDNWKSGEKKTVTYSGTTLVQCYNEKNDYVGNIISYTISGLANGFYTADVDLNVHCADWNCTAETGKAGKNNVVILKANNQYTTSPLQNNRDAVGSSRNRTISNIYVSDGTITFTLTSLTTGANWISVKINSIDYVSADYTLNVSSAGWASLCLPYSAAIPLGVEAFYARLADASSITLSPITSGSLAANEPVIVRASAGAHVFESASPIASIDGNLLSGTTQHKYDFASNSTYVLKGVTSGVPYFALLVADEDLAAGQIYLPAYKAYIASSLLVDPEPAPGQRIMLVIEGENNTTSVEAIDAAVKTQKIFRNGQLLIIRGSETYDVTGRRIQ